MLRHPGNDISVFTVLLLAVLLLFHADVASGSTSEPSKPPNTFAPSPNSSLSKSSTEVVQNSASTNSPSTCPSRTVNYLTHTLPQKCLKTNWTRHASHGTILIDGQESIAGSSQTGGASSTLPGSDPSSPSSVIANGEGEVQANGASTWADSRVDSHSSQDDQTSSTVTTTTDLTPTATETDSPLDNSKFLSFEEWKKQNLEKLDQKPDDFRKRQPGLEDSANGEGEIDLGFLGSSGSHESSDGAGSTQEQKQKLPVEKATPDAPLRRKDAGTTCKERFNYASTDCAATVLKTNPKCKSPSAILVENKDSYMLNECSIDNKFLIVELCENILIDTVVLANFEYFSSMFRTFRVSISDRYPVKTDRWTDLGIFTARNSRDVQAFAVENPLIWAKYVRVEFLTQYGNEYYCPVSLFRIHGTTMIEDLRPHEDPGKDEDEIEIAAASPVPVATNKQREVDQESVLKQVPPKGSTGDNQESSVNSADEQSSGQEVESSQHTATISSQVSSQSQPTYSTESAVSVVSDSEAPSGTNSSSESVDSCTPGSQPIINDTNSTVTPATTPSSDNAPSASSNIDSSSSQASSGVDGKASLSSIASAPFEIKKGQPSPESVKPPPTIPQPPAPSPTTQESFFKSVHKRLQVLEANATLSLQYIEEQSRILRDAFTTVEKRQLSKTEDFLRHLNNSVMTELKNFRQQYDQLWQSTVLELESHREQYQREILAVSTRLTILADEVVWQKRMAVAQSFLLLLCLFLVVFGRSGSNHLELPLMQHVLNKSHSMMHFPLDSAPGSPSSKYNSPDRSLVRHQSSGLSGDEAPLLSRSGSPSPTYNESLTATPNTEFSPAPSKTDMDGDESPLVDERVRALRRGEGRSRSGPATPRGTRDVQDPMMWSIESRKASFASSKSSIDDETEVNTNGDMHNHSRTGSPTVRFGRSRLANGTDQDVVAGADFSTEHSSREEG